jgi:hypothetical protein
MLDTRRRRDFRETRRSMLFIVACFVVTGVGSLATTPESGSVQGVEPGNTKPWITRVAV